MNKKTINIDLSKEEFFENYFNPLAAFQGDDENIYEYDNKFGWNVSKAEIIIDNSSNKLLEYRLISNTNITQSHGKRVITPEIEYWYFEFLGRETKYSPDNFKPRLDLLLEFFYSNVIKQKALFKRDILLPIINYEVSSEKELISVRYSLSAEQEICKPLFHITIDNQGYLHTISDWQLIDNKHTVFPTPTYKESYILQDFSDSGKCNSYAPIEIQANLKEGEFYFENHKVKYLYNSDLENKLKEYGFFISDLRNIIHDAELLLKYIPTINYHILKPCNMECLHCFSDFNELEKSRLDFLQAKKVILEIGKIKSFRKLNFSGGEPTLFNGIEKLIKQAKDIGIKEVSLVTNGYKLVHDSFYFNSLIDNLDILVFSIDSFDSEKNKKIGRHVKGRTLSFHDLKKLADQCEYQGVKIKINTVVTKRNCNQVLANEIAQLKPIRWKILRMLPLTGQNDNDLVPSNSEFKRFIELNKDISVKNNIKVVLEENEDMTGSYLMISPDGKFFNNVKGEHNYSNSILSVGIKKALSETPLMREVFYKREGDYSCN